MGEAVLQIAVVVLVRFRMNDNRVRQGGGLDQFYMVFQRIGGRLVGRVRRIGDAPGIEEVNVGLDGRRRGGGEQGAGRRSHAYQRLTASEGVSHGCCYSRWPNSVLWQDSPIWPLLGRQLSADPWRLTATYRIPNCQGRGMPPHLASPLRPGIQRAQRLTRPF